MFIASRMIQQRLHVGYFSRNSEILFIVHLSEISFIVVWKLNRDLSNMCDINQHILNFFFSPMMGLWVSVYVLGINDNFEKICTKCISGENQK